MLVELDHIALVNLVSGVVPEYEQMKYLKDYGNYCGGFKDEWTWDRYRLLEKSDVKLWDLYVTLRSK